MHVAGDRPARYPLIVVVGYHLDEVVRIVVILVHHEGVILGRVVFVLDLDGVIAIGIGVLVGLLGFDLIQGYQLGTVSLVLILGWCLLACDDRGRRPAERHWNRGRDDFAGIGRDDGVLVEIVEPLPGCRSDPLGTEFGSRHACTPLLLLVARVDAAPSFDNT